MKGAAESLPHADRIQESFGHHDLTQVRVYAGPVAQKAARQLGAKAFTQGDKIAFKTGADSLHTAAHEAAHVVQQRQGGTLPGGTGQPGDRYEKHADAVAHLTVQGRSAASLLDRGPGGSLGWTVAMPPVQMAKDDEFKGPTDVPANLVAGMENIGYPGESHSVLAGKALTNCCDDYNEITTAGESLNNKKSSPGAPTDFEKYNKTKDNNDAWNRPGGLVKDKNRKQAATQMHVINHRLDSTWTQDDAKNVFLGTKLSNKKHEERVESKVKGALEKNPHNKEYELELARAEEKKDTTNTEDVLFWDGNDAAVDTDAVDEDQLQPAVWHKGSTDKVTLGAAAAAAAAAGDVQGQALVVDVNTAQNNFLHRWVTYRVTPVYPGAYAALPAYVQGNFTHEAKVVANLVAHSPLKAKRTPLLGTFKAWAVEAFPVEFKATAKYYTASYKQAKAYRMEEDAEESYSTDL